jgi:Ubiquitin-conjugating enzyme
MKNPLPGIFVELDEELTTVVHAVLTGPFDTPYEGGFFSFVLHMPDRYPHEPPKCRLQTTGSNTVRFGPNLYRYYHILLLSFQCTEASSALTVEAPNRCQFPCSLSGV